MKRIIVLNLLALATTILLSVCDAREILYIGVYLFNVLVIVRFYKYNKKNINYKYYKWLFMVIFGLLISNILVVVFHDAVKWIARPYFWILSISYVVLLFFYAHAFMVRKAKLSECSIMIMLITTVLLISLPVYRYYRLSYSVKYKNNALIYKHYVDALYEETTFYCNDSCCYVKNINQENRVITIYYDSYPSDISHIDTIFIEKYF